MRSLLPRLLSAALVLSSAPARGQPPPADRKFRDLDEVVKGAREVDDPTNLCSSAPPHFSRSPLGQPLPPVYHNLVTHWWDGSQMYGVTKDLLLCRASDDMVHRIGQDGGFVSALLIWAMEEGYRKDNPVEQTRRPKKRPAEVYRLTREEAVRMLAACRQPVNRVR